MDKNVFIDKLAKSFEAGFDLSFEEEFGCFNYDFIARFNVRNSKYVLLKKAEVYSFKNFEYVLCKDFDKLTIETMDRIKEEIKENIYKLVEIDKEHMSSTITILLTGDQELDSALKKKIKKFKFYKSFALGFKGWINTKLIYIDRNTGETVSNKIGKSSAKNLKSVIQAF